MKRISFCLLVTVILSTQASGRHSLTLQQRMPAPPAQQDTPQKLAKNARDDFGSGLIEPSELSPTEAEKQLALPLSEAEERLNEPELSALLPLPNP